MSRMSPFRVRVERLRTDGIAEAQYHERRVEITGALQDELVVVKPDRVTKSLIKGRVLRLVEASADRAEAYCQHLGHCTGCPLGHMPLPDADRLKLAHLHEMLGPLFERLTPSMVSQLMALKIERPSSSLGYRALAKMTFAQREEKLFLGSFARGTHHVVDNLGCAVLSRPLATLVDELHAVVNAYGVEVGDDQNPGLRHAMLRWSTSHNEALIVLLTKGEQNKAPQLPLSEMWDALKESGLAVGLIHHHLPQAQGALMRGEEVQTLGRDSIQQTMLGFDHDIGARDFFQINPVAAEVMFQGVVDYLSEDSVVLELGAGVGALSFPLAQKVKSLCAVEREAEAARRLRARAESLDFKNITVVEGDMADVGWPDHIDVVVADPPRKGLGQSVVERIAASSAKKVVLLACDVKALRQDLPGLLDADFVLVDFAAIDQFPNTAHFEAVVYLERS